MEQPIPGQEVPRIEILLSIRKNFTAHQIKTTAEPLAKFLDNTSRGQEALGVIDLAIKNANEQVPVDLPNSQDWKNHRSRLQELKVAISTSRQ